MLHAVHSCVFVPCVLLLLLYAVYCHIRICAMNTVTSYIISCVCYISCKLCTAKFLHWFICCVLWISTASLYTVWYVLPHVFWTDAATIKIVLAIISYKLSAACIITKLSVDSIQYNNRKTPIVCGKCHMVHEVTVLLSWIPVI